MVVLGFSRPKCGTLAPRYQYEIWRQTGCALAMQAHTSFSLSLELKTSADDACHTMDTHCTRSCLLWGPIGPVHSEAKFTLVTLVSVCSGAIVHLLTAAQAATFSWRIVQAGLAASYAPMLMS